MSLPQISAAKAKELIDRGAVLRDIRDHPLSYPRAN
jgi:hypothetical protein